MSVFESQYEETGLKLVLVPQQNKSFREVLNEEIWKIFIPSRRKLRKIEIYASGFYVYHGGAKLWFSLASSNGFIREQLRRRNHRIELITNSYQRYFSSLLEYRCSGYWGNHFKYIGTNFTKEETFYFSIPEKTSKFIDEKFKVDLTRLDWCDILKGYSGVNYTL